MTGARRYRSGHCGVGRHHACPHLCAGVLCSCACHQQPTDLMDGAAMATVLTVGNSEGARRCDAKCHEASEPDCDCVCGGRYHGKGSQGAMDLIQDDLRAGRFGAELAHLAGQLTAEALQDTLF